MTVVDFMLQTSFDREFKFFFFKSIFDMNKGTINQPASIPIGILGRERGEKVN